MKHEDTDNSKVGAPTESHKPLVEQIEKTKVKPKSYVMDLRIHSPASLGYLGIEGIDTAPALVRLAKVKGLDVIAVTDFYSGDFIDRIMEASKNTSVTVIPGVVIRCCLGACDDVVLSCLFPEDFSTAKVQEFLFSLGIPSSAFGNRKYVVKNPLAEILSKVEQFGGVVIPSRMDKTPHRLAAIKALVEDFGFRTFDLAYSDSEQIFKAKWPKIKFNLFSFSSAYALAQVGSRIARVKMKDPGFVGVRQIASRSAAL